MRRWGGAKRIQEEGTNPNKEPFKEKGCGRDSTTTHWAPNTESKWHEIVLER